MAVAPTEATPVTTTTAATTVTAAPTSPPAPTSTAMPAAQSTPAEDEEDLWATATPVPTATPAQNPFAAAIQPLSPAPIGEAAFGSLPVPDRVPVGIEIESLGIDAAPVTDVGVNPDQTFEVPAADEVGWYRFGPTPGSAGSSVLAAHIAFDGVDGVFRNLVDLSPGAIVNVVFDDGSTESFRVESITEYDKQGLPDSLWAKEGRSQLALITCGGIFNRQLNSYESNTVAIATPLP